MRIVIVGGGVMGCATALELARGGAHDIVVLERAVPGAEASSAAAGMLAAQIESSDDAELDRFVRARDAYRAWAEELREETGIDVGWRKTGALVLVRNEKDLELARAMVAHQTARALRAELVAKESVRGIDVEVKSGEHGALHLPDEAQVDPPQLLRALTAALSRARGVVVRSGFTVSSLLVEKSRAVGVAIADREPIHADAVVLAAGSWSSLLPGVPAEIPRVRPIRGQLAMVEERPPHLATIVLSGDAYVVPRGDGRVICGSTMEDVGHRRQVTAGAVQWILEEAIGMAPALAHAELVKTWCNFRPASEGGAPLVGASPLPGLFLATGHHRNGILLAKATAESVAAAIAG